MDTFAKGDRVEVIALDTEVFGIVYSIYFDDRGEPVYTVSLDNTSLTPDGEYIARGFELRRAS